MLFNDITIIDEHFEVREHMYVGVRGDRIEYLDTAEPKEDFGEKYNGADRLLIPAFYNAHSHLPMVMMRGYGENMTLMDWLFNRIFPFESRMKLNKEDFYYGTMFGAAEMLRYGIAGTQEMYIDPGPQCRAVLDSGIKANVSVANACGWKEEISLYDMEDYRTTDSALREYHHAGNDRLHVEFSVHSEYRISEKVTRQTSEEAEKRGVGIHVHIAETEGEVKECRERRGGRSPVKFFHDCGLFRVPTLAAHCVWTDDEDIAILKADGVSVATCPKSNAKLASGIAPAYAMLKAGINLAIGTDSVASNNNLNFLEEMRFFNLIQKVTQCSPEVITPAQTLYAATRAGAIAQQREDCGLIKKGFKADLAVLNIEGVWMRPIYNLLNNLIFAASGSDVVLTMVDGRTLYRDGEYPEMDMERIEYEIRNRCDRILGELAASSAK